MRIATLGAWAATCPLLLALLAACTRASSSDFQAARLPACAHTKKIPSEPHSDHERLRAAIEKAAAVYMHRYDRFMKGELAAYEAVATIEGKTFGPMRGVVREDSVGGNIRESLSLAGAPNHAITISPRAESRGDVLVQTPFLSEFASPLIVCNGCADDPRLRVRALYDESLDWYSEEQVPADVPGGRRTVRQKVRVRVSVKRIEPASVDLSILRSLFDLPAATSKNSTPDSFAFTPYDQPYVVVPRPANVDAKYGACELTLREPADIRVDPACPANWSVDLRSDATRIRCCTRPPYHGPPQSGHSPEDCLSLE